MILTFLRRLYIQCSTRSLRLLLWGHTVKFEGRRNLGRTHPRWSLWSVAPHIKKGKRRQSDYEIWMQNVFENCASNAQRWQRRSCQGCLHACWFQESPLGRIRKERGCRTIGSTDELARPMATISFKALAFYGISVTIFWLSFGWPYIFVCGIILFKKNPFGCMHQFSAMHMWRIVIKIPPRINPGMVWREFAWCYYNL